MIETMRKLLVVVIMAVLIGITSSGPAGAAETKRIAYFEAGPFWLFNQTYAAARAALETSDQYNLAFPEELRVSPGWNASASELDRQARTLQERDDIDVLIVAGTAAVRSILRVNSGRIPIIGIGMADPVAAVVVKSADDSGVDNFTCEVIPDRWRQMVRVFHDVVGFHRLGILVPPGLEGRVYSGIDDIQAVGKELGFTVVACDIPDESVKSCSDGIDWLAKEKVDAFFIGPLIGFDWEEGDPEYLLNRLNQVYKLPTFARDGSIFVQGGALMGFATWDFSRDGKRLAEKIIMILDGKKPRAIPMRSAIEPLIAINLQTAVEIGFDLPFDVLIAADEIYVETKRPNLK